MWPTTLRVWRSLSRKSSRRPFPRRPGLRPRVETLEDRTVPTSFSGAVFDDAAGSGAYSGQPGLAGWAVWLDQNRDGIPEGNEPATVTDAGGHYSLDTTVSRSARGREPPAAATWHSASRTAPAAAGRRPPRLCR
jgi:hypothetical protein